MGAPDFRIYTDGSASPNPGRGGYAAAICRGLDNALIRVISGGFVYTTNNRMELLAAIRGLEALETGATVVVVSDSKYVVNGVDWSKRWSGQGWKHKNGEPFLNTDLWKRLHDAILRHDQVTFEWIRGHQGDTMNERCDKEAAIAAKSAVHEDTGYTPPAKSAKPIKPVHTHRTCVYCGHAHSCPA